MDDSSFGAFCAYHITAGIVFSRHGKRQCPKPAGWRVIWAACWLWTREAVLLVPWAQVIKTRVWSQLNLPGRSSCLGNHLWLLPFFAGNVEGRWLHAEESECLWSQYQIGMFVGDFFDANRSCAQSPVRGTTPWWFFSLLCYRPQQIADQAQETRSLPM